MAFTLSHVPPDVWPRIASHLTLADLQNLSLTSVSVNRLITSDCVFREIFFNRSSTPPANTSWQNLYRRLHAITHCPSCIPTPFNDATFPSRIVASIGDTLIVSHGHKLTGYPYGWMIDVRPLCGDLDILTCSVPMHTGLGILHNLKGQWYSETSQRTVAFTTLSLHTGASIHCIQIPVGAKGIHVLNCTMQPMNPLRAVFLGGHDSCFLVYFVDHGRQLLVVERTTGACVRRFDMAKPLKRNVRGDAFMRLVRGGSGYIRDGFVVVGVIEKINKVSQAATKVTLGILGGSKEEIDLEEGVELIDIVRSRNGALAWRAKGRDHITIWRAESWNHDQKWPMRIYGTNTTELLHASTEFSISDDGRNVFLMPKGLALINNVQAEGRVLRLAFKGSVLTSTECLSGKGLPWNECWSWATACAGGRVIIAAIYESGVFAAFDLSEGTRVWSLKCEDAVTEAVVVGEHYLFAIGQRGRSYTWHFDKFCPRQGGGFSIGTCVPIHSSILPPGRSIARS